jgi:hypothetical protein
MLLHGADWAGHRLDSGVSGLGQEEEVMRVSETPVCTYEGCKEPGDHEQLDKCDKPWAHLCDEHAARLDNAIISANPKLLISTWIKAQGGAKAAAKRF